MRRLHSQTTRFAATSLAGMNTRAVASSQQSNPSPKATVSKKTTIHTNFSHFLGTRLWKTYPTGDHCVLYVDTNSIGWIVMNRAGSSANALGESFVESLSKAFDEADKLFESDHIQAIVLASAKSSFCVGADLEQLYPVTDPKFGEFASSEAHRFFARIASSTYPVVAAINGQALGGGLELALACHHRLAASGAKIGLPETMLGLLPGAGGTVRLPKLVGVRTALKWILSGAPQSADRAYRAGAVDRVFPDDNRHSSDFRFLSAVRSHVSTRFIEKRLRPAASRIGWLDWILERTSFGRRMVISQTCSQLNKKTNGKYVAHYKALESVVYGVANRGNSKAFAYEAKVFGELLVTPEAKNQCALYFLDNRLKQVVERTGVEELPLAKKSIGVIGAGVMGSGIAHNLLKVAADRLVIKDVSEAAVSSGLSQIEAELKGAIKRKRLTEQKAKELRKRLHGGTNDSVLNGCEVIVEAAVEVLSVKQDILRGLEASGVLGKDAIFATNTSSLSITGLQGVSANPSRVVGMHYFNPVSRMPLVEVVQGKKTSKEAVAAIYQLALEGGKKPIVVRDAPGFVVNRILAAYMNEAARLVLRDGACPVHVDRTIVGFGMPMGPFRLLDEVGLDIISHVSGVLAEGLGERFKAPSCVVRMLKDGYLGRKNKRGIYRYDPVSGKELGIDTTVVDKYLTGTPNKIFPKKEIVDRCILTMVNEAATILSKGIASGPEEIDTGMVFGTGFAPFRGGLLQYADHRGLDDVVQTLQALHKKCGDEHLQPDPLLVEMAKAKKRFFPHRPFVPYVERTGYPSVRQS